VRAFYQVLQTDFAPWFPRASTGKWITLAKALQAIEPTEADRATFYELTGRTQWPDAPIREGYFIVGRRGGKSLFLAAWAIYQLLYRSHSKILKPGEHGLVAVIAPDRDQARVIFRYARAIVKGVPKLSKMLESATKESLDFKNGKTLEVTTASFRTVRGYTLLAGLVDELAFLRSDESANPDTELLAALRPGMATVPDAALLCISTPYARRGALWEAYDTSYGKDGDPVLVVKAPTLTMNPTLDPDVVAKALAKDASAASAEYLAVFRADVETVITREMLDRAIIPDRIELPPGPFRYFAACDPAGGGADSYTLAIAHNENGRAIVDVCKGWTAKSGSVREITHAIVTILREYRIEWVAGDRYGGTWPANAFMELGIGYKFAPESASENMAALIAAWPLIELPDSPELKRELLDLERRTTLAGRDTIGHPPGAGRHDDHVAAVALAVRLALGRRLVIEPEEPEPPKPERDPVIEQWARQHGHYHEGRDTEGDWKAACAAYRLAHPSASDGRSYRDRFRQAEGIADRFNRLMHHAEYADASERD
jgi:hypothetical protein